MLAGVFSDSGYHMGESLYPPRDTNPKGFFESDEINNLNELILRLNAKQTLWDRLYRGYNRRLKHSQRWLCAYSANRRFVCDDDLREMIQTETAKAPFCYKDPRFIYTYPLWAPYCGDHVCLVIYRHPAKTIESMIKEISTQPYLQSCEQSIGRLSAVWSKQYERILSISNSNFMFVHFDQLFEADTVVRLSEFTGCSRIADFPDRKLMRSTGESIIPSSNCMEVYAQLNKAAGYSEEG